MSAADVDMGGAYDPLELLTVQDLAALLKVTPDWAYRAYERGVIPGVKLSHRQLRFRRRDVVQFLNSLQHS